MKKVIIISDFFKEDFEKQGVPCGGAELNDAVLFDHLISKDMVKLKIRSNQAPTKQMIEFIKQNKDEVFLISNFSNMHFRVTATLLKYCKYFIYEHDYKFHKYRNPINFDQFRVPENQLVNVNFFKRAQEVICLSKLHKDIFSENLSITNIYNTTCSLWSDDILDFIEENCESEKNGKLAVVDTDNPIKRKKECEQYCVSENLEYDLISSPDYKEFLKKLSEYKGVVILPGHPEPTPRVAVEAKMLNCEIHSNPRTLGVAHEEWFKLSGKELIAEIRKIKEATLNHITERIMSA